LTTPGWYPDPGGCWDLRWWDGRAWADDVQTGLHQAKDPYPPIPLAVDRSACIWLAVSRTASLGDERYLLTGDALHIYRGDTPRGAIPIWGIANLDVRVNTGQHARGVGDVVVTVAYSGYYGPSTFVLRSVDDPHAAKAAIRRQIGMWSITS
jgi:hypothetical protein